MPRKACLKNARVTSVAFATCERFCDVEVVGADALVGVEDGRRFVQDDCRTRATPVVCTAIWDTGAAFSVVSSEVVRQLKLPALGKEPVHTANGMYLANVYSVDVMLPNKLVESGVEVTDSDLKLCDALFGMDVIALGDMKVSNKGNTKFTFRIPSKGDEPM